MITSNFQINHETSKNDQKNENGGSIEQEKRRRKLREEQIQENKKDNREEEERGEWSIKNLQTGYKREAQKQETEEAVALERERGLLALPLPRGILALLMLKSFCAPFCCIFN